MDILCQGFFNSMNESVRPQFPLHKLGMAQIVDEKTCRISVADYIRRGEHTCFKKDAAMLLQIGRHSSK